MNKHKRKPFFIKGNFQIAVIASFTLLLFIEVITAGLFIYKLSANAVEDAEYSSHITINSGSQLIKPIILKVNTYAILISILLAGLVAAIMYFRLRALFANIINGLENLRDNNTSFRINQYGIKNTRELIEEFNQAASSLDKRRGELQVALDSLIKETDTGHISKLHNRLYSLILQSYIPG